MHAAAPCRPRGALGFTLVEALVTLMIVALVAAAVSTGIAFAVRQYSESMETSQAIVLMSTLKDTISNELAITENVELGAEGDDGSREVESFFSAYYGTRDGFSEFKLLNESGGFGELALGASDDASTWKKLVSSRSYPKGLGANVQVRYYEAEGEGSSVPARFVVKLELGNAEKGAMYQEEFDVVPYNKVDVTVSG